MTAMPHNGKEEDFQLFMALLDGDRRELAYRLYTICERKKRAAEALSYNGLVQSWPEIMRAAARRRAREPAQGELFSLDGEQ